MLDTISAQLGTNLAVIAKEQGLSLVPIQNSLLEQLCTSMTAKMAMGYQAINMPDLQACLVSAASGDQHEVNGSKGYRNSSHDSVMDNYIKDLSELVSQHVVFARSVVYPQVKSYAAVVGETLRATQVGAAEDMFNLTYWKLDDVYKSDLVAEEVEPAYGSRTYSQYVELGQVLSADKTLEHLVTGDPAEDKLITAWYHGVCERDAGAVAGYLMPRSGSLEFSLNGKALMDYHLAGFLFYRHLVIHQDLSLPYSQVDLLTRAKTNREYHASQLSAQLRRFEGDVSRGVLIAAHPADGFSYLSSTPLSVVLYQEVFDTATQEGVTLEQIFGCFAAGESGGLTVADLKENAEKWTMQWTKTRALYMAYMQQSASQTLRTALGLSVFSAIDTAQVPEGEEHPAGNAAFRAQTSQLVVAYIDTLEDEELQDLANVSLHVIARLVYRHTNAYALLREMLRFVETDQDLSMSDAAALSVLCYVCDFVCEQAMASPSKI